MVHVQTVFFFGNRKSRAHWRTDEFRIFQEPAFLDWVAGTGIRLIGFREIREFMDSRPA